MSNFNTELNIAKEASLIASKILISNKEEFNKVLSDEGRDIKLKADLESELAIKKYLEANSEYPILGEESGANMELGNTFWVVDPLDGTSNYSRDFPIFFISISLIYHDEIVLGLINDLETNKIRCDVDLRNEKIGYKIREHSENGCPIILIVGEK